MNNTYSSTGNMGELSGVECNVSNCYYNKQGQLCTAAKIKVGPTSANTSDDTVCDTFKPQ